MKKIVGVVLVLLSCATIAWALKIPGAPTNAEKQELIALEHSWKLSVINRDAAALQRLYADEYASLDSEGQLWNKADDIAIDTAGDSYLKSFALDEVNVRTYGTVAVVTGRNTSTGWLFGRPARAAYRFTDVFVRRDDRWQVVSSQMTPILAE